MYEAFFGLTQTPFPKSLPAQQLFQSPAFQELQKRFDYIKSYRGIMMLTGDSGVGKTSAVRYLLNSLDPQLFYPVYLPLSTVSVGDFYRQLNAALKGNPGYHKSVVFKSIQEQVLDMAFNRNILPVIIFDEAHLLKDANIQELQIITNFRCDSIDPAVIVLVGHEDLMGKLSRPIHNSFYQRVSMRYKLAPLTRDETRLYILHHLKICGCEEPLFSDSAFEQIHKISRGCLRMIGSVSTRALILAFMNKKRKIESDDVLTVSQEVL